MSELDFINSPEYQGAEAPIQQQMVQDAFDQGIGGDEVFQGASSEIQNQVRSDFMREAETKSYYSPHSEQAIQAREAEKNLKYQSFGEILWDKTKRSVRDLGTAFAVTDDLTTGQFDDDFGRRIAASIIRQNTAATPAEQKALMHEFNVAGKEFDAAKTGWEKSQAVFKGILNVGVEAITNPKGTIYTGVDSISSLGSSLAAGWAGAKIGAGAALIAGQAGPQAAAPEEIVTVPALAVMGGMVGMFIGSLPAEAKGKFQEEIISELKKRDLVPNEKNINALVQDKGFTIPALKKARTKAAVIGVAEAVSGGIIGKAGKVVSKARTAKGLAAGKASLFAAETVSEGLGEAASQLATEGKIDLGEVLAESVGALGMAPISTAIEKGIFAGDVTKEVATKQFKTVMAGKSDAHKQDIKIQKEERQAGYRASVEAGDIDTPVADLVQPGTADYNPVKASHILARRDDEQSYDQMKEARDTYVQDTLAIGDQIQEIQQKEKLTGDDKKQVIQLNKQYKTRLVNIGKLDATLALKDKQRNEAVTDIKKIDPKTSTPEEVVTAVTKSLGSHGRENAVTNEQIDATIKSQPDMPGGVKTFLSNVMKSSLVRDEVNTHAQSMGKSLTDVRGDIHRGSTGFKGIDNFHMAISNSLGTGDTKGANTALGQLMGFEKIHVNKAATVTQILSDVQAGRESSPGILEAYKELQGKRGSSLVIHKNSDSLVKAIQLDAKALTQAVQTAESMIAAQDLKVSEKAPKEPEPITVKEPKQETDEKEQTEKQAEEKAPTKETIPEVPGKVKKPEPVEKAPEREDLSERLDLNFDKIPVTVIPPGGGTPKSIPYDQAINDINEEITLYKGLLKCVQG